MRERRAGCIGWTRLRRRGDVIAFRRGPKGRLDAFRWLRWVGVLALAPWVGCDSPDLDPDRSVGRIAIDGHFEDWEQVPVAVRDAVDPPAVLADFTEVRVASDGHSLFLGLRFQDRLLIRASGGTVGLLIDADGDPATGWNEQGMKGIDLALQGTLGADRLAGDNRAIEIRVWPPDAAPPPPSEQVSLTRSGVMRAPAFASDQLEIRVPRGLSIPTSDGPLLTGDRARIKIVSIFEDGRVVDEVEPFDVELVRYRSSEEADEAEAGVEQSVDPLARLSTTRLRILEWNVSHRTLATREDHIVRILAALSPDLLLLNEVSDAFSPDDVHRVLERAGIQDATGAAQVVYGLGGGDERAVVAGRVPLSELSVLTDLPFPLLDVSRFLPPDRDPRELTAQVEQGIQAAGAAATVQGRRLMLVSLGLASRGQRPFEIEEYVRRIQASTIASAMSRARSESSFDGIVVAGDLNLVVSELPVITLASRPDPGGKPLSVINPLQLDGRSNATWANPDVRFAAGRLDFMLHSAETLSLDRAFVFDSHDLSPRWLQHHGLSEEISSEASDHFPIVADFRW